jgi:hypothetical protein
MFEAAAMRTAMVLIRGRYSGLLKPDEHYIALEPDYSNIDCVLERIQDVPALQAMAERAYQHLIATDAYSYRAYLQRLDEILEQAISERPSPEPRPAMAALESGLVSRKPFGHDPFLLRQHKLLFTANTHIDRLLGEVRMYGEALEKLGNERNRLFAENKRLIEENNYLKKDNSQLRRGLTSVVLLRWIWRMTVGRLMGMARIAARKLRNSWRELKPRG